VTNVFKYAYPKGITGDIFITVNPMVEDEISLTISDHGVGMPDGLDWQNSSSLGLRIIRVLARQLAGELELDVQHGVAFTLRFRRDTATRALTAASAAA
jgi:two-component sensor histidine kinase